MSLANSQIKKENEAFTLLELLAVIVVLAIIALIAVPIILNVIENSKKNAAVTSARNYIKAVETYIGVSEFDKDTDTLQKNQKYNVTKTTQVGESICKATNDLVKISGKKPYGNDDYVLIGERYNVIEAILTIDGYKIAIKNGKVESITKEGEKESPIDAYPVGSVYISSKNVNPSTQLGGTWQLIDKKFATLLKYCDTPGQCTEYFVPTENISWSSIMVLRQGKRVRIRLYFSNLVMLNDTTIQLGTFQLNALGINSPLPYNLYNQLAGSDDGNGASMIRVSTNGNLSSVDVVGRTATIVAGSHLAYDFIYDVNMDKMLDEACDKFYWKRIS